MSREKQIENLAEEILEEFASCYEHTKEIKTCLNWITRPPQNWCYVESEG